MKTALNSIEIFLYFLGWIAGNIYSLTLLYKEQNHILANNSEQIPYLGYLQPGWKFLQRLRDDSDVDWGCFRFYFQTAWSYLIIQFIISELIRRKANSFLKHWYIISTMVFITLYMGWKHLAITMFQPLLYFGIILCGGNKSVIWVTSVILLASYNTLKFKNFFWLLLDHPNLLDEEVYLFLGCLAWVELRCISYCLDYVNKKESAEIPKSQTIINILSYVLYLPVLYMGPVILYENFEKQFKNHGETLANRLRRFSYDAVLFLIYGLVFDLVQHYIVFYAIQENIELLHKFSAVALAGGGLWMGIHFHVKYVINYGFNTAMARLDHIEAPPTPRCIARIHVYSDMWRHFDVGLYKFLVKYIYIPTYQSITSNYHVPELPAKCLSSMMTFMFIFIWHGSTKQIFVWSLLNYLGIILETLGRTISETEKYSWFKTKFLKTDAMETRFKALLCSPLLILSAVSNFYLFAGSEVGDLYFQCFWKPNLYGTVIIFSSMYCCCQVAMALQDVPSRTDVDRITVKKVREIKSE